MKPEHKTHICKLAGLCLYGTSVYPPYVPEPLDLPCPHVEPHEPYDCDEVQACTWAVPMGLGKKCLCITIRKKP